MKRQVMIAVGGVAVAAVVLVSGAESSGFEPRLNPNHDCSYCHSIHGSPGPSLTVAADVEVLCLTCHGAAGTSSFKAEVHTNKPRRSEFDPFSFTCISCHDPHSELPNWLTGTNIRLVGTHADGTGLSRILTLNNGIQDVVFESRGTNVGDVLLHSFADGDEDGNGIYDGICEVCHTLTGNHSNSAGTSNHNHNRGKTCTVCHDHADGFNR